MAFVRSIPLFSEFHLLCYAGGYLTRFDYSKPIRAPETDRLIFHSHVRCLLGFPIAFRAIKIYISSILGRQSSLVNFQQGVPSAGEVGI